MPAEWGQGGGDGRDVSERNRLLQQLAIDPMLQAVAELGLEVFRQLGRLQGEALHQLLDVVVLEQLRQVLANDLF